MKTRRRAPRAQPSRPVSLAPAAVSPSKTARVHRTPGGIVAQPPPTRRQPRRSAGDARGRVISGVARNAIARSILRVAPRRARTVRRKLSPNPLQAPSRPSGARAPRTHQASRGNPENFSGCRCSITTGRRWCVFSERVRIADTATTVALTVLGPFPPRRDRLPRAFVDERKMGDES